MAAPVHTPIPATRVIRTDTAHPPVFGVPTTSEWLAQRTAARRQSWWRRLITRQPS